MKNVFSINVTNKSNEAFDGVVFMTHSVSKEHERDAEALSEEIERVRKSTEFPYGLRILKYVLAVFVLLCLRAITSSEVTVAEAYENAPLLFYIVGICIVLFIALIVFERKRLKNMKKSGALEEVNAKALIMLDASKQELGVPNDAADMDVLLFRYKEKNGKTKIDDIFGVKYINLEVNVFVDSGALCFATSMERYSIPLSSIMRVRKVKKSITLPGWNKDEPHNKGEYKQFRIAWSHDMYTIKGYYCLSIVHNLEEYELFVPEYEINTLRRFLDLPIIEE